MFYLPILKYMYSLSCNVRVSVSLLLCLNPASFPVVLGDFGCDVTCQACRENSPRTPSRYRARFQASAGHSDSANRPGYEAGLNPLIVFFFSFRSGLD